VQSARVEPVGDDMTVNQSALPVILKRCVVAPHRRGSTAERPAAH
jgi:hypothetical protein